MTRAKYNKNPKLTREQWIVFFKQQTTQVEIFMGALEEAYKKIETFEGTLVSPSQGAFSLQPRICLPNLQIIKSKIAILEDLFFFQAILDGICRSRYKKLNIISNHKA